MAFPSDVSLPANAKYFTVIETAKKYNPNYDITWTFSFAATASNLDTQYAISTFLIPVSSLTINSLSSIPGHYVGVPYENAFLASESGEIITTESGEYISVYSNTSGAFISVALDTTGLFALSGTTFYDVPGVNINNRVPNSLIVRDNAYNVKCNLPLSSFNSQVTMLTSSKQYQTLRFRYANSGRKISIDHRTDSSKFINLTSINIENTIVVPNEAYVGFSFTSPVSTTLTNTVDFFFKDFHIDGTLKDVNTETIAITPLSSQIYSIFTTLSGVTATKYNG